MTKRTKPFVSIHKPKENGYIPPARNTNELNANQSIAGEASTARPVSNVCHYCCKFCSTEEELVKHEITHTVNKELKCPDCGMGFARRSYLVEHACIHNGEKPHVCYYCNKAFTLRCNLVRHVRIHTGEKPFACTICKKPFILKKNMIEHKRTHTGEKPYKCQHCDFTFSRRSSLVRHSRIHTGEKTYECHECQKSFSWKYYLRRHMTTHMTKKNKVKRKRKRKSVEIFMKSMEENTFIDTVIKKELFVSLPKETTFALEEEPCDMNNLEDMKTDSDIIICSDLMMNTLPNDMEDINSCSDETFGMVEDDDKSAVEVCEHESAQTTESVGLPVFKKQLTVVVPRTNISCSQSSRLIHDQNEDNESVTEPCEIIKFKMTKNEFDNFCNKRLLVRLQRLEDYTPVDMYEE